MATAANQRLEDPISFEIFKNSMIGLADEMGLVTMRTAHSPNIAHALDFSTAICDRYGRVVAQGNGMMIHVGTYPDAMRVVLERYGARIEPGDVYIFNDSDEAAQHLNDLYVIKPYFIQDELIGFGMSTCHHGDLGGSVPGSLSLSAYEIFQEGLQIPPVRLYAAGRWNDDVWDFIARNIRRPDIYFGDLMGQVAAVGAGEAGLASLVGRYTLAGLQELSEELMSYAERLTRTSIQQLSDGTYEFRDWIDDDGVDPGHDPIPIRVKVTVDGDEVVVDWTGTSPQVASSINCHMSNTRSVTYGVLTAVLGGEIPSNDGLYRPVTVVAPEGSLINARRPAARAFRGIGCCYRMIDVLLGAFHQVAPDRVPAGSDGGITSIQLDGTDGDGRSWREMLTGAGMAGWGGRPGADGPDYVSPLGANVALTPIELTERTHLLMIEGIGYEMDTAGPGRWRGCLSIRTDVKLLCDEAMLTLREQRHKTRAYGLVGGSPGSPSRLVVNEGEADEEVQPQMAYRPLGKGDRISYRHSSGGGYGVPFGRDPEAVLVDVLDEKISTVHARDVYGVVIDVVGECIDHRQTEELRNA